MGLRGIAFVLKAETGGQELGSDRVSRRTKNLVVKLALGRLRNNVVSSGPTPFLLKQRVVQTVTRGSHGREPERAGHPEPLPEPPKIEKEKREGRHRARPERARERGARLTQKAERNKNPHDLTKN